MVAASPSPVDSPVFEYPAPRPQDVGILGMEMYFPRRVRLPLASAHLPP